MALTANLSLALPHQGIEPRVFGLKVWRSTTELCPPVIYKKVPVVRWPHKTWSWWRKLTSVTMTLAGGPIEVMMCSGVCIPMSPICTGPAIIMGGPHPFTAAPGGGPWTRKCYTEFTLSRQDGSFVTLPPEMSRIAAWSLLGYSQISQRGCHTIDFGFSNEISFSSLFYIRKYTSYTHRKFISVISKCLKQATLQ